MTMNKAIGLSPTAFGFGGGLFFIGYFLFEVPSNLILHRVGARIWIARVMITWGSCRLYLHSRPAELLRAAFPARHGRSRVLPRHHPVPEPVVSREAARGGRRVVHGGRADLDRDRFAVVGRDHADAADVRLADWQMLYIVEALPAVVLGFVVLRCLTDAPSKAAWLRADERDWLVAKLKAEADARHTHAGHTAGAWQALATHACWRSR